MFNIILQILEAAGDGFRVLLNNYCCKLEATEYMLISSGKDWLDESASYEL